MKFNNKRLVIAMVGLFVFSLALVGCGGSGGGGGAAKPEEVLVIGSIQDMSGTTSVFGNAVTRGAEVAIEKLNAKGGINGKKVKLVFLDRPFPTSAWRLLRSPIARKCRSSAASLIPG